MRVDRRRAARCSRVVSPYVVYPDVLSTSECDAICGRIRHDGGWGTSPLGDLPTSTGKQVEQHVLPAQPYRDLYEKLFQVIRQANRDNFKLNPELYLGDPMVALKYEQGGFRGWHVDGFTDDGGCSGHRYTARKLSLTLQLTNPSDYEGGDLEFFQYHQTSSPAVFRRQGSAIVFPAFEWHQITPVTRGTRLTALMFASGTPFR